MTAATDDAEPAAAGGDGAADLAVRTTGLTKRFRSGQVAVDGIDLQVPRGAVYGFLGPNGSGKTTTIRMLLGLTRPTAGRASPGWTPPTPPPTRAPPGHAATPRWSGSASAPLPTSATGSTPSA
jgi:ABC-2 type transport system ATP-binding protein